MKLAILGLLLVVLVGCTPVTQVPSRYADETVQYENGIVSYRVTVEKPTPCHQIEIVEMKTGTIPLEVEIEIQTIPPPDDVICIQVTEIEEISGSIEVESEPERVTIFIDGIQVY